MKRQAYDLRWSGIKETLRAEQQSARWAAEAKAKAQKEESARQERLQDLALTKSRLDRDIFDLSRTIRRLNVDLQRIQDQDEQDLREEKQRNSWWTYFTHGKVRETEEQIQNRDTTRLHRRASKTIKESKLSEENSRLQRLQSALQSTECKMAVEKQKAEEEKSKLQEEKRKADEEARARKARMEQEAINRKVQEMRERMAREQKEYADRAARAAAEAREAQAAREAQERARTVAAAVERRRQEAEERARVTRAAEEAIRKARKTDGPQAATRGSCRHDRFWPKIEGRLSCGHCHAVQNRFAFECPGCKMVACASCRQSLRGSLKRGGRRYGFASGDDDEFL